jgi:hypothetical protein
MLFGLAQSPRSLTTSPAAAAISQAHRAARRRLEAGGAAVAGQSKAVDDRDDPADFILPPDIDAALVEAAIQGKLGGGRLQAGLGKDALSVVERRAGGRIVLPARHLLRLGDGRYDLGRGYMRGIVNQIRARRVRLNPGA